MIYRLVLRVLLSWSVLLPVTISASESTTKEFRENVASAGDSFYSVEEPGEAFKIDYDVRYVLKTREYIFAPNLENKLSHLVPQFFRDSNLKDLSLYARFDDPKITDPATLLMWLEEEGFDFNAVQKQFFIFKAEAGTFALIGVLNLEKIERGDKIGVALSLFIDRGHQNMRVASSLAKQCLAWLTAEYPMVSFIENTVRADNLRSLALCYKMGMEVVANGEAYYPNLSSMPAPGLAGGNELRWEKHAYNVLRLHLHP